MRKKVFLFSCHGGDGKEGQNVAWMFAKITDSTVRACTGSVSYSKLFGKYRARKAADKGIWKNFKYKKSIFGGEKVARSGLGLPKLWYSQKNIISCYWSTANGGSCDHECLSL